MLKVTSARHWVELGATPRAIQTAAAGGESALAALKKHVRLRYHELMREHHPDVGGDIERAKALNIAHEEIQAIQIMPRPEPRQNIIIVYGGPLYSDTSTTATAPAPFSFWWGT